MRIAVATWSCREIGGVEAYLSDVMPALSALGHATALICETETPSDRSKIRLADSTQVWSREASGVDALLARLRDWRPDLIFCHGLADADLEEALTAEAPSVFYAHNYYGCCISGAKTFRLPEVRPCARRFGPACLLQFYPRRCGGLNPLTMLRLYRREAHHLNRLRRFAKIVTASEHMRRAYLLQGFADSFVSALRPPVEGVRDGACQGDGNSRSFDEWRLLFLGRMTTLKGGEMLLDALPDLAARAPRRLRVVFAGDGPARRYWQRRAAELVSINSRLAIEFPGWLSGSARTEILTRSHLLVMPSLWPEPFGRAGLEAARFGVPTAAFAVGGIPEWLHDGVNGHLASADPPSARALADAIFQCLSERPHWAQLARNACNQARQYSARRHAEELTQLFEDCLRDG